MKYAVVGALCAFTASVAPVAAATLDPVELLQSFNAIILNDFDNRIHVHGRTFVGGNYSAPELSELTKDPVTNYEIVDGLSGTVFIGGNVTGQGFRSMRGDVKIGGTVAPGALADSQNGGVVSQNVAGIPVEDVRAAMLEYALFLADLGAAAGTTGALGGDSNNRVFATGAVTDAIEFFNVDGSFFDNQNTNFSATAGVPTVVNVAGEIVDFKGKISNANPNLIFNFYEATELSFNQTFSAHIIAPKAMVDARSNFYGMIVASSLSLRDGEIHPLDFPDLPSPPVSQAPLPASAFLLLGGLGLLGGLRARRKAA